MCGIPRDSILSARTASLRPDTPVEDFAGYVLQLTTCLLHELRLARASEWYGWLQALPRDTIEIPTLWADPDLGGDDGQRGLEWLAGTEAEREIDNKNRDGLSLVGHLHWQSRGTVGLGAETSRQICENITLHSTFHRPMNTPTPHHSLHSSTPTP